MGTKRKLTLNRARRVLSKFCYEQIRSQTGIPTYKFYNFLKDNGLHMQESSAQYSFDDTTIGSKLSHMSLFGNGKVVESSPYVGIKHQYHLKTKTPLYQMQVPYIPTTLGGIPSTIPLNIPRRSLMGKGRPRSAKRFPGANYKLVSKHMRVFKGEIYLGSISVYYVDKGVIKFNTAEVFKKDHAVKMFRFAEERLGKYQNPDILSMSSNHEGNAFGISYGYGLAKDAFKQGKYKPRFGGDMGKAYYQRELYPHCILFNSQGKVHISLMKMNDLPDDFCMLPHKLKRFTWDLVRGSK